MLSSRLIPALVFHLLSSFCFGATSKKWRYNRFAVFFQLIGDNSAWLQPKTVFHPSALQRELELCIKSHSSKSTALHLHRGDSAEKVRALFNNKTKKAEVSHELTLQWMHRTVSLPLEPIWIITLFPPTFHLPRNRVSFVWPCDRVGSLLLGREICYI